MKQQQPPTAMPTASVLPQLDVADIRAAMERLVQSQHAFLAAHAQPLELPCVREPADRKGKAKLSPEMRRVTNAGDVLVPVRLPSGVTLDDLREAIRNIGQDPSKVFGVGQPGEQNPAPGTRKARSTGGAAKASTRATARSWQEPRTWQPAGATAAEDMATSALVMPRLASMPTAAGRNRRASLCSSQLAGQPSRSVRRLCRRDATKVAGVCPRLGRRAHPGRCARRIRGLRYGRWRRRAR